MTDSLDMLPEEVREALHRIERNFFISADYGTIRAELLRLAQQETDLRRLMLKNRDDAIAFLDRAERAEAELATARATAKHLNRRVQMAESGLTEKLKESAPGSLGRSLANAAAEKYMHERDEALAEVARLCGRIAGAPIAKWLGVYADHGAWVLEDRENRMWPQRVRIIPMDDEQ